MELFQGKMAVEKSSAAPHVDEQDVIVIEWEEFKGHVDRLKKAKAAGMDQLKAETIIFADDDGTKAKKLKL